MAATLPTLPLTTYEPTYPSPASWDGCDDTPANATAFQTSLNKCTDGNKNYRITLTAGTTYAGNFVFPAKATNPSGTGWVLIRSSAVASLPAQNYRIDPTLHTAYMPTIQKNSGNPAIEIPDQANPMHHVWFDGILFTNSSGNEIWECVKLGSATTSTRANVPHHFAFSRCIGRGYEGTGGESLKSIGVYCDYFYMRDSYIYRCMSTGNESQCLIFINTAGPITLINNFFGDATENIMFGGGDDSVSGNIPSDITIKFCHFKKNASLYGTAWDDYTKNVFEIKNAQRVLVRGCIFENMWVGGQYGQYHLLNLKSVNQDGGATWAVCQDVTIRDCILRHSSGMVQMTSSQGTVTTPARRIRFYNCLAYDIDNTAWGSAPVAAVFCIGCANDEHLSDIVVDHLTIENQYGETGYTEVTNWPVPTNEKITTFEFKNSVFYKGSGWYTGFMGNGSTPDGDGTFDMYYISPTVNKDIVIAATAADWNGYGTNWTPANDTGLFVDKSGGNFRLASPGSYVGDDSLTVGADIDTIEAWTLHTEDGQNPQDYGISPTGPIYLTVS